MRAAPYTEGEEEEGTQRGRAACGLQTEKQWMKERCFESFSPMSLHSDKMTAFAARVYLRGCDTCSRLLWSHPIYRISRKIHSHPDPFLKNQLQIPVQFRQLVCPEFVTPGLTWHVTSCNKTH